MPDAWTEYILDDLWVILFVRSVSYLVETSVRQYYSYEYVTFFSNLLFYV
jgi:hypothetical protein